MENYEIIKQLGKGSYGEVCVARDLRTSKKYVLKKIDLVKSSQKERENAKQEATLLARLKHPNIVAYRESFYSPDGTALHIAMAFCEGGDMFSKVKKQRGVHFSERQLLEWFIQSALAIQYLHNNNILHRDLKTQNIFLTKNNIVKLGDFGIARILDSVTDMATTMIGTPYYMSPELFSNEPYNFKSDIWALGCCMYEAATLKQAFSAANLNSLVYKVLNGKVAPLPDIYSADFNSLVLCMMDRAPERRPTINEMLKMRFVRSSIESFLGSQPRKATADRSHGDGNTGVGSSTESATSTQASLHSAPSTHKSVGPASSSLAAATSAATAALPGEDRRATAECSDVPSSTLSSVSTAHTSSKPRSAAQSSELASGRSISDGQEYSHPAPAPALRSVSEAAAIPASGRAGPCLSVQRASAAWETHPPDAAMAALHLRSPHTSDTQSSGAHSTPGAPSTSLAAAGPERTPQSRAGPTASTGSAGSINHDARSRWRERKAAAVSAHASPSAAAGPAIAAGRTSSLRSQHSSVSSRVSQSSGPRGSQPLSDSAGHDMDDTLSLSSDSDEPSSPAEVAMSWLDEPDESAVSPAPRAPSRDDLDAPTPSRGPLIERAEKLRFCAISQIGDRSYTKALQIWRSLGPDATEDALVQLLGSEVYERVRGVLAELMMCEDAIIQRRL